MRKTCPSFLSSSLAAALGLAGLFSLAGPARADEGMWTFDNAPLQLIQQRYGLTLSPAWLEHVRKSAVRFGASASFVSKDGLLLTNHHVARGCIARLSTAERDLIANGFVAATREQELQCPGADARVLMSWEDVTATVTAAARPGMSDAEAAAARKAAIAKLESDCKSSTGMKCDVVTLYSGALYHLYRYKEWQDVRLVVAPEGHASDFGGDPDNFNFPRFALDFSLLRVYENGKPVQPEHYLKLASQAPREGDPVFVIGHPGNTDRLNTVAQLEAKRDALLPLAIAGAKAQLKTLAAYGAQSPESARRAHALVAGIENTLKANTGQLKSLQDPANFERKRQEEAQFRAGYAKLGRQDQPWAQVEAATRRQVELAREAAYANAGFNTLLGTAMTLVEIARERALPEGERMRGYSANGLAAAERRVRADVPTYKDLELARYTLQLARAQQALGIDHPFVKASVGPQTPGAAAQALIDGTRLDQLAERVRLLEGGAAAIDASTDPAIVLARQLYPLQREQSRRMEREVDEPLKRAAELLGRARFELMGKSVSPDATGTLRFSYGRLAGYESDGYRLPYKTVFGGLFARADAFDNVPPFKVAPKVAAARNQLDMSVPMNFVSTNDIIGGNSGSPIVNKDGELVGLIFDGNLDSLGGRFLYDERLNRATSVDVRAILQALEKVYGAPHVAKELRGQ